MRLWSACGGSSSSRRSLTPHRVYIGIGSNQGDRQANALAAVDRIAQLPVTRVVRVSSLYESEPWGDAATWFVNGAIEVETEAEPKALLEQLQGIEEALGRRRVAGRRWASRVIDLDILLWDRCVLDEPSLTVPHPEMHRRRFVLLPLAELAADVVHPVLEQTIAALLATVQDDKRVTLLRP